MAEKTILVCDLCGKPAEVQRTIDVCTYHSHDLPSAKSSKYKSVKCKCGEVFRGGQGAAAHARAIHNWKPGQKHMWTLLEEEEIAS
jgi:hypothetical protein